MKKLKRLDKPSYLTTPDWDVNVCMRHCDEYNIQSKEDEIELLGKDHRTKFGILIQPVDYCRICEENYK